MKFKDGRCYCNYPQVRNGRCVICGGEENPEVREVFEDGSDERQEGDDTQDY